ncbi:hypothetical protein ACFL33_03140 [Pseudomonadota bacterium]
MTVEVGVKLTESQIDSTSKRIAFIHPEGNFANNPHLSAVVDKLCEQGYKVDIHAIKRSHHQCLRDTRVQVYLHSAYLIRITELLARFNLGHYLARALCLAQFPRFEADLVIGVDPDGVIIASYLGRRSRCPTALFSYEIFFAAEAGTSRKAAEIRACSGIEFAVVQDPKRGRLLARENRIDPTKLIFMPVAASKSLTTEPGWLRNSLGISHDKKIALFMGSLEQWTGFDQVLRGLPMWPDDWCLVVHGRYGLTKKKRNELSRRTRGTLYFSTEAFPTNDDLGKLMGDADLGIGVYCPSYTSVYTGLNLEHVGLASGKISSFLRFGVPVLVNQIGEMAAYVEHYGLGDVVTSVEDIPFMLKSLGPKDTDASERCRFFFDEKLAVERTIQPLLKRIDEICG